MTRVRLYDQAGFAAFFILAAVLGRQTVPDDGGLALAWPAAGVAAAWFAATGWRRWLVVDAVLMFVCAWMVNDLTGADTGLAIGLALGTVVQVVVFGALIGRWCPEMWGFGDEPPPGVQSQRDLGMLMVAAFLSAGVAALTGPTTILFLTDGSWVSLGTWVLRNAVSVIAIFPLSLLARNAARARQSAGLAGLGRGGIAEAGLLGVVTIGASWVVFVFNNTLPVPFLLLGTCVWAGARFSSWVADIHALLVSTSVVVFTLLGEGPFSTIDDVGMRQVIVQAYVLLVVSINLALSVQRREGLQLNRRLARSEADQRNQATMLRTILDTMADGVSVLGADGRLVLRNPAAAHLVGDPRTDAEGRIGDSASYGIFNLDGSPIDPGTGPVAQAMAGEDGGSIDVFVRNAAAPDGRVLAVTARPVPESDPPLVVSVYHDVTSDRRERDELASFAGVVAHDLLNPLTVVEGWSEALLEEARAGTVVPPAMQADQLERIVRAAQRMQHLISDLLAYTTARDLKIKPVRVDLRAVALDVARARVDAARVHDAVPPRISVPDELPDVLAEPVLLRQVVDNLVGNAVKYVAPGVVPEIDVTAMVQPGGDRPMVLIEISDNGIGIPEEQQSRVFDTFHRAHTDSGYRGTGLGLSIVKRIAERHDGTAWAATNPATGGTTMSVTFPAADRD